MSSLPPPISVRVKGALIRSWPFITLGAVTLLHITKVISVDGYAITLLTLTFLPVLIKTLTTYFESFKIGKDGIEAKAFADNRGKTSEELVERIALANSKSPVDTAFPYPDDSRAILATLWHFQKKFFGEDSLQRWGFGIGIGSPDYRSFNNGLGALSENNLVHQDQRGICYLTNEGITFCKEHTAILDADGPFYTNFAPVPNN